MFLTCSSTSKGEFAIRVQNYNYLFEWENVSVPYFLKYMHFLLVLWRRFLRKGVCNRVAKNYSWHIQKYWQWYSSWPQFRILYFEWRWRRHRSVTAGYAGSAPSESGGRMMHPGGVPQQMGNWILGHPFRERFITSHSRGYSLRSNAPVIERWRLQRHWWLVIHNSSNCYIIAKK